jgi:hypothetical protein
MAPPFIITEEEIDEAVPIKTLDTVFTGLERDGNGG